MAQSTQVDLRARGWVSSKLCFGAERSFFVPPNVPKLRCGPEVLANDALSDRSILEFAFLLLVPWTMSAIGDPAQFLPRGGEQSGFSDL
jgi:hypothetical protein